LNNYNISPDIYQKALEETQKELLDKINQLNQMQENVKEINDPNEIIQRLDTKTRSKIQSWLNVLTSEQSKGFLFGMGTAALLGILVPATGQRIHSVVSKTTHEGLDIIERVRSLAAKVKEELEDIVAEASYNQLRQEIDQEIIPKDNPKTDGPETFLH
jgi:hypothetical protein